MHDIHISEKSVLRFGSCLGGSDAITGIFSLGVEAERGVD